MPGNGNGYILRRARGGRDGRERHYFTVPRWIAERLPPDERYEPILTEEGILYRPTSLPPAPEEVPEWVKK